MKKVKQVLSFSVDVRVEEREGYFAATTTPFAITTYGKTDEEAEKRALKAINLSLDRHSKSLDELSNYLNHLSVQHSVHVQGSMEFRRPIVRECRREMHIEARASA